MNTNIPNAYDRRALNGVITRAINETKKAGETCHEALIHAVLACRPEDGNDKTGGSGFGDPTFLRRLLNEMPRAGRTEAMVDWVMFFFPISIKRDKETNLWTVAVYREGKTKKFRPWNWTGDATSDHPMAKRGALNVPYFDLTDERPQKPLSIAQLLGMIKDAKAKVDKAKEENRPVVGETEASMAALTRAAEALGLEDADIAKMKELEKAQVIELNEARLARKAAALGDTLGERLAG